MSDQVGYVNMLNASAKVVEVFKTNVQDKRVAKMIIMDLAQLLPDSKISFDLEDCDKILRIESHQIIIEKVIAIVRRVGFKCELLE